MNIRTARGDSDRSRPGCRASWPAATLGSESRAPLGHLIGQSGILGQEGVTR